MPKLWTRTIETHRREVGDAILDSAATLVAEHGLRGVTMSRIAEQAGVGRATLYKYYPDAESILVAWHERHVARHLARLEQLRQEASDPGTAVATVLDAYAVIVHDRARRSGGTDVAAVVHQGARVAPVEQRLRTFLSELLAEAARAGQVRADVPAGELAEYCLHALGAAAGAPDRAAVRHVVDCTLTGVGARAVRVTGNRPPAR